MLKLITKMEEILRESPLSPEDPHSERQERYRNSVSFYLDTWEQPDSI